MSATKNARDFKNVTEVYSKADIADWYQIPGGFDYVAAMESAGATHAVLTETADKKSLRPANVGDICHYVNGKTLTIAANTALNMAPGAGLTIDIVSNGPDPSATRHKEETQEDAERRREEERSRMPRLQPML